MQAWKPNYIICWSTEQGIGNYSCMSLLYISLHPLGFYFYIFINLCSRYFVIPLWKGSGYTTMFTQGWSLFAILCLTVLHIIHLVVVWCESWSVCYKRKIIVLVASLAILPILWLEVYLFIYFYGSEILIQDSCANSLDSFMSCMSGAF